MSEHHRPLCMKRQVARNFIINQRSQVSAHSAFGLIFEDDLRFRLMQARKMKQEWLYLCQYAWLSAGSDDVRRRGKIVVAIHEPKRILGNRLDTGQSIFLLFP